MMKLHHNSLIYVCAALLAASSPMVSGCSNQRGGGGFDGGGTPAVDGGGTPAADGGGTPAVDGGGATTPTCDGDFSLGSTFYSDSSAGIGHACSPEGNPQNCRDGWFAMFPDGGCYCVLGCGSLTDNRDGAPCTTDGAWVCRHVLATNAGANEARICVPETWRLCLHPDDRSGGYGGGGGGAQDAGSGGGGGRDAGGGECRPEGAPCTDDGQCCSTWCSLDDTCN